MLPFDCKFLSACNQHIDRISIRLSMESASIGAYPQRPVFVIGKFIMHYTGDFIQFPLFLDNSKCKSFVLSRRLLWQNLNSKYLPIPRFFSIRSKVGIVIIPAYIRNTVGHRVHLSKWEDLRHNSLAGPVWIRNFTQLPLNCLGLCRMFSFTINLVENL